MLSLLSTIYPDFLHSVSWEPLGNAGGFSGASIYCGKEHGIPRWCLRIAPPDFSAERLQCAQHVMRLARSGGLSFVPTIYPTRTGEGFFLDPVARRLVELMDWMPGEADFHRSPSPIKLFAAIDALGEFHRAVRGEGYRSGPSIGIRRRLAVLDTPLEVPRFASSLVQRAEKLLRVHRPVAVRTLLPCSGRRFRLQHCLCDIRDDHVLFQGDRVSGIIDYSATRVDHIAVDLARLLGSTIPDDGAGMKAAIAHYGRINPIDEDIFDLVAMLDWTGTLAAIQVGIERLHHLRGEATNAYEGRLQKLVERMERRGVE